MRTPTGFGRFEKVGPLFKSNIMSLIMNYFAVMPMSSSQGRHQNDTEKQMMSESLLFKNASFSLPT